MATTIYRVEKAIEKPQVGQAVQWGFADLEEHGYGVIVRVKAKDDIRIKVESSKTFEEGSYVKADLKELRQVSNWQRDVLQTKFERFISR